MFLSYLIFAVCIQPEYHTTTHCMATVVCLNKFYSIFMLSTQHSNGWVAVMLLYLSWSHRPLNKSTEVSPTIPPDSSHSRGDIINCCSRDQCLWEEGGGGRGSESHCSCSFCFGSLRQIPGCPYDGWRPFWNGRLVLGIMVNWEPRAVRSETAAVPSALQAGPPGASALPRKKGGVINQSVWGAILYLTIHLSPWSLMEKTG